MYGQDKFLACCKNFGVCRKPSLATHEAPEWGNEGIMAAVSELASGVAGLAKTLVAGRANGYRAGDYPKIAH